MTTDHENADHAPCTDTTLKEDYAFSVIDYRGDSIAAANVTDFADAETGSYKVNRDCTGEPSDQFECTLRPRRHLPRGNRERAFVISDGVGPCTVSSLKHSPGATQPLHTQTRVDFWKVGSEQDN
jgi:hypothetical protein